MGNLFDKPEVKCATGVGLSVLGLGWAAPFAAEACVDVVQEAVAKVETSAYQTADNLRQSLCESQPSNSAWDFLLGVVSPITTIAMRYPGFACESKGVEYLDLLKEGARAALPFAAFGLGGLGASLLVNYAREESHHRLVETFAAGMVNSAVTMGALRSLRTLHHITGKAAPLRVETLKLIEVEASKLKAGK